MGEALGTWGRLARVVAPAAFAGEVGSNGDRGGRAAVRSDGWGPPPPPGDGIAAKLAEAQIARAVPTVTTREQAIRNSVVNRARDIVCGVLASLPFTVTRDRAGVLEELPPGWLNRPDPDHSRAWFVSWVTDDLFFQGCAAARITVEDVDGRAVALQWMPWTQLEPTPDGRRLVWRRGWYPDPWTPQTGLVDVVLERRDVVLFELPLVGVLNGADRVLTTAAQLDASANRFAGAELAAGWLKQTGGEQESEDGATELVNRWALSRLANAIGYLNETLDYHESEIDPSRLQLVEGRAYQDAQAARVCNMPNYVVGVGVPNDSMTYKTALTARLDLLDFGLEPFVECWGQTLSDDRVTPHGTTVAFDLEPFLRTATLTPVASSGAENPPSSTPTSSSSSTA
jgi:hypothetical protein